MIDLIICLTLLNMGMNCNTSEEYNREMVKIENVMNHELPCKASAGELKNQCNDVNLNAILRNYHFDMQANRLEME